MRLQSLEIQGFKSFYERITFSFNSGITTIVGPNGCGKSNILDAILWATGERSAKHLRGKVMEDVIFAGADRIKPLGMAEVNLVLANDDGGCPERYKEIDEIMISRRLFRSGESEYLINRTPCRLRDVIDLFLDMGLGHQAYSIVEQGKIEAIITSKPEERRIFIEEAAGIAKFRERRREALAKMELTEQNLLRIQDVIGEIRRQIQSLERQVRKAERFKNLRKEIRQAELSLACTEFRRLSSKQTEDENALARLKKDEESHSAHLQERQKTTNTLKNRCAEWEERINTTERTIYETKGTIDREEGRIESCNREQRNLKNLEVQYGEEIDELNAKLQAAKGGRAALQAEFKDLGERINKKEKELESKDAHWQILQERWDGAADELENQKADLVELLSRRSERTNQIAFCERNLRELANRKKHSSQEIEETKKHLDENQSLRLDKEASHKSLKVKQQKCAEKAKTLGEEITLREEEMAQTESRMKAVEGQYQMALSKLRSLEELQRSFEGFDEGVKTIMLSPDATPAGIRCLVADIMETEPSYEAAVSAVLSHRLQYLVVRNHREGLVALDMLKKRGRGRIGLVPVGLVGPERQSPSPLEGRKGIIGPLLNHVKFKAEYEHLGTQLLGNVWLVEDLASAIQIWQEGRSFQFLVTLEGEVMDGSGIIIGGSREGQAFQILERRSRIKDLAAAVAKSRSELDDHRGTLEKTQKRLAEVRSRLDAQEEEKHALALECVAMERDIERLSQEADENERRQKVLVFERDQLESQAEAVEKESLEARQKLDGLDKDLRSGKDSIEKSKAALEEWEKQRDVMDKERTQLQVEIAEWREQRKGSQKNLDSLETQERELREQTSRRLELLDNNRKAIHRTEQDIQEAHALVRDWKKKAEETDGRLKLEKQALKEKSKELGDLEDASRRDQIRLEELRKKVHEKNLEVAETHLNLNHVVEGVLERYQIDIRISPPPEEETTGEIPGQTELARLKASLDSLGEVNLVALQEHEDLKERSEFLVNQQEDLRFSLNRLKKAIQQIDRTTKKRFVEAFEGTNEKFQALFPRLFNGGKAALVMTDEDDVLNTGIEILAQLPGKRLQRLDLLSGGEKALVAIGLIFSFFLYRPTPFCLLDEVDAPLDDANVAKFLEMIQELADQSQLIVITHNKKTMEVAQTLYGITMETPGVSKVVSVKLNDPKSDTASPPLEDRAVLH